MRVYNGIMLAGASVYIQVRKENGVTTEWDDDETHR